MRKARRRRAPSRRNYWRGQRKRHSIAAVRGWWPRSKGGKMRKRFKKRPASTARPRKRRKSRRKNSRRSRMSRRFRFNKRRRGGRRVRYNRRRRGGRRVRYNRRRRGGRRVRYNRRRRGGRRTRFNRRRRNPVRTKKTLSIKKPAQMLMAGYDVGTLQSAAVVTAGALANGALYKLATGMVPFTPAVLKSGPGAIAGKIAFAGVTGALVGIAAPKMAAEVFFGGVLQAVMDAVNVYVAPLIPGLSGFGDYLSVSDAQGARPLGDYLSVSDARNARALGDYLTVDDARNARSLGVMPDEIGESYIAEELAAIA